MDALVYLRIYVAALRRWAVVGLCAATPLWVQAQMVNYSDAMSNYKDAQKGNIDLLDKVSAQVAAKTQIKKALRENRVVNAQTLRQPDGTLKLPRNRQNTVIRTNYNDVQYGADGKVRIASPQINGNINGKVILYVEGKGPGNVTVLNR